MSLTAHPIRVPGLPLIGNALRLLRDPLGFTRFCARTHGDVVDMNIPVTPTWLVSHPDLIEEVLVRDARSYIKDRTTRDLREFLGDGLLTSEGEGWKHRRRLLQPGFHREKVASYGAVMVELCERMLEGFVPGQERDIHAEMIHLTRAIAAKTLFNADITGEAKVIGDAFATILKRFADIPPGVPFARQIPSPGKGRYDEAVRTLDDFILGLVRERRKSGYDPGDLLSMLMAARDEEGRALEDRQIRDEALTLFVAGHETTANALAWTFLLLGLYPAARERLFCAIDEVLEGRAPTVADLSRLREAERTILESLRLFPPAWAIGREAIVDTKIGHYEIKKGTQVWISQYVVHHDARFFDAPEAFRPERWEGDLQKRLHRFAYFPFGGGPRICIGNTFAMMEAILVLSTISRRFRLELVPGQSIAPAPEITLRPRGGVRVMLERR